MKKKYLIFLLFPLFSLGQIQIGTDINGKSSNDYSHLTSISSDGSILAIGSYGAENETGSVSVFRNISGVWTQIGSNIRGTSLQDLFGQSVSLSSDGNIVAIGSYFSDINGVNSGLVRVFKNVADVWTQIGSDIYGIGGDQAGKVSLSSDGGIVAIGASSASPNGAYSGQVRIFKNVSGVWSQIGNEINGKASGDSAGVGLSLSSDGNTVAIGASGANPGNGGSSGQVRVFQNISGVWTQIGNDINGEAAGDQSGSSISLSSNGDIVAIGATLNDGNGQNSGHVRVYKNVLGTWVQIGNDINGESGGDNAGSVSISSDGNILAVGAYYNTGNGLGMATGQVRVFQNISGIWTKIGDEINGKSAGDGTSVCSLSSNGRILAVGSQNSDANGVGYGAGQVRIYDFSSVLSSNNFEKISFIIYPNPVSEMINITLNDDSIFEKVNIYNHLGQLIKIEYKTSFSIIDFSKGSYFFEVITDKEKSTKNIVVE